MKKLKLEALEITSFETTSAPAAERGTVDGQAAPQTRNCPLVTYSPQACGETNYMDCTYGCSYATDCPYRCVEPLDTAADCTVA